MIRLTYFSLRQPSWVILACFLGAFELSGCTSLSDLMGLQNTSNTEQPLAAEASTPSPPSPSLEEVEEAISTTKTLLDDQQKQVGGLLSLRGEVKQALREFQDKNLIPMNAAIQALQHQVGAWEGATATNQTTVSSAIKNLAENVEQTKARVEIYGEQATALADQIDQNNRQYEKLLTEFQDSLLGFKGVMSELKVDLTAEKNRAAKKEGTLATQLKNQQQTLDQVAHKTKNFLEIQKRLNQLHVYINQVRDTLTSDTLALKTALKAEESNKLQDLVTSLQQQYQELAQSSNTNTVLTEQLQALEHRLEQSEKHHDETLETLRNNIQTISMAQQDGLQAQETENLQALVLSLEERYQQLNETPSQNPALTEHINALEQRVEQSEKHYAETVKRLHEDIQEISVGMRAALKNNSRDNLQEIVTSLEQRYEQLTQAPSADPTLTEHLQALEQRVKQSEKNHAETVEALQNDVQAISARVMTLAQSFSPETVEALHHDIQEVSAGMLKLAQSISHLEKTKAPTTAIHTQSTAAPANQE